MTCDECGEPFEETREELGDYIIDGMACGCSTHLDPEQSQLVLADNRWAQEGPLQKEIKRDRKIPLGEIGRSVGAFKDEEVEIHSAGPGRIELRFHEEARDRIEEA